MMGSTTTLVDAAGHYMRKDIDVVREVVDGLGVDLGILGTVLDGGPARFTRPLTRSRTAAESPLTSTDPFDGRRSGSGRYSESPGAQGGAPTWWP